MPRGAQREPEDPFDAGGGERVDRVLDVARVLVFEIVVADGDDHGVAELRAHRLDELDGARRAHALIRAAVTLDPPARRHLEVEVDALPRIATALSSPGIASATESPMSVTCWTPVGTCG